nr:hypothetical protein HmN_000485400 [Hymenolepis microstoma]
MIVDNLTTKLPDEYVRRYFALDSKSENWSVDFQLPWQITEYFSANSKVNWNDFQQDPKDEVFFIEVWLREFIEESVNILRRSQKAILLL